MVLSLDVTSIIAGTQYRGQAEERFQDLIDFLENYPKCILFIDEIHTVLGAGACKDGELDLANALKPILARGDTQVIGATTFDEYEKYFSRDGALQRRFEKIVVEEPKSTELYNMIKNQIARLENYHQTTISRKLVNDAILLAGCFNNYIRNPDRTLDLLDRSMASAELKGRHFVKRNDILENFDIKRKQFEKMSKEEKTATAYHEAGHAIVSWYLPTQKKVKEISIIPRGMAGGYTMYKTDEDKSYISKTEMEEKLIALLGGRAVERVALDDISTGASNDIEVATTIAKDMIVKYGMNDFIGPISLKNENGEYELDMFGKEMGDKIGEEVKKLIDTAYNDAQIILRQHLDKLDAVAEELLANEKINEETFKKFFDGEE